MTTQARAALTTAAALVVVIALVPLIALVAQFVSGSAMAKLGDTLGRGATWALLLRSIGLALMVTLVALCIGVPMGMLVARTDAVFARVAFAIHCVPVFLPPVVLALGWFHLLGREGMVGSAWTSSLLFGWWGVVMTLGFALAPIVSALTLIGLLGINPSLEEAGRTSHTPLRVLTRISLPLAARSIALAAVIVFALALSELGVPMFLRVKTYPAAVFTRVAGLSYAPGEALALVTPLLLVAGLLVLVDRRWLGPLSATGMGMRSATPTRYSLGRHRVVTSCALWLVALLPLAPLLALIDAASAGGFGRARWWMHDSLATSLVIATAAATVVVALGIIVGHALARSGRAASLIDAGATLSFFVPSAVLGAGLIATWNRPSTQLVYTTAAILVVGLTARYAVVGTRTLTAVFARSSAHYEHAAAVAGASYLRRLARIVLPMHARGVIGVWLLAFVFCMRDLDTVIVFYPPGLDPLTVRIFTLEANGPPSVVAALCLVQTAVTLVAVGLGLLLLSRVGRRVA